MTNPAKKEPENTIVRFSETLAQLSVGRPLRGSDDPEGGLRQPVRHSGGDGSREVRREFQELQIAAVELSATILLVSTESQVPMSDGFYLYMQSVVAGDCCLGNLAFLLAAPAADRGGRPRPDRWRALPLHSGVGGL
jgi:hypothetical protein